MYLVVVASEHDADYVLADVVNVAFDGREHQLAPRVPHPGGFLLGEHERLEVCDRALHRPRALDHLRQEHLSRAEEIAHHAHAVHQRTFDHLERLAVLLPRLLGVGLDVRHLAVQHGERKTLLDCPFAPAEVDLALRAGA